MNLGLVPIIDMSHDTSKQQEIRFDLEFLSQCVGEADDPECHPFPSNFGFSRF